MWYSPSPSTSLQMAVFRLFLWLSKTVPYYSIVCMHSVFRIQSSSEGRFGCFHLFVTGRNAAVNIGVHKSLQTFSHFSGRSPRGVAGSYGNSVLNYLRNANTIFHSDHTSLHSHQQWVRASFSPQRISLALVVGYLSRWWQPF